MIEQDGEQIEILSLFVVWYMMLGVGCHITGQIFAMASIIERSPRLFAWYVEAIRGIG
jgi:hypothetical protein